MAETSPRASLSVTSHTPDAHALLMVGYKACALSGRLVLPTPVARNGLGGLGAAVAGRTTSTRSASGAWSRSCTQPAVAGRRLRRRCRRRSGPLLPAPYAFCNRWSASDWATLISTASLSQSRRTKILRQGRRSVLTPGPARGGVARDTASSSVIRPAKGPGRLRPPRWSSLPRTATLAALQHWAATT